MGHPIIAAGFRIWPTWPAPTTPASEPVGDNPDRLDAQLRIPGTNANRPNGKPVLHLVKDDTQEGAM